MLSVYVTIVLLISQLWNTSSMTASYPATPLSPTISVFSVRSFASSTSPAGPGRPNKSPVWDYFMFDQTNGKSICQIIINDVSEATDETCGHSVRRKFPTNLKQHLKRVHPKEYDELELYLFTNLLNA